MENQTHKQWRKNFIEELKNKKFEAEVNLRALQRILPEMQNTRERILSNINISKEFIKEMVADPSYEARQKRKNEEDKLKEWEIKLEDQNLQIYGGEKNGKKIIGLIQKADDLELTIKNLSIYIEESIKNK